MSITDELRKYADDLDNKAAMKSEHGFSPVGMKLGRIADSIDARHQCEVDEARMDAFSMSNHRVTLPLDADGEPIDLGDELCPVDDPEHHSPVEFMTLTEKGWMVDGECDPSELRHWGAPTVDVLLKHLVFDAIDIDSMNVTAMVALANDYADRIREAVAHEEDE